MAEKPGPPGRARPALPAVTAWEGAYCGPAPLPADLLGQWNLDPAALAVVALAALWAGASRSGWMAVAVLAVAFVSPLCALSSALFSARVAHHVLMVALAAPLLALARPAGRPTGAAAPFLASTAALWLWHAPGPYDAALSHAGLYWLMQASLLLSALWFWRAAFSRPDGAGAPWVLFAWMAMGLLGAILTLAPRALYGAHAVGPLLWGTDPLADQQLGGLLMWVPAGLPFAAFGLMLARRAWAAAERPA